MIFSCLRLKYLKLLYVKNINSLTIIIYIHCRANKNFMATKSLIYNIQF